MKITLFGLGRVGLPFALYLSKFHQVTGYDVDAKRIKQVSEKQFPFKEAGGPELLVENLNKSFFVTSDPAAAVSAADVIIITVGTPVNGYMNPSFSQIDDVFTTILPHLKANQLIILRSTLAPGTVERLKRMLEGKSAFKVGKNLFLAYCPERTAEGRTIEEMPLIPQLIGSLDPESAKKAEKFFEGLVPETILSDSRSVEIAKLICNMYRYINFALANELMMIADKNQRDIYEIVHLVNHNYVRGGVAKPGLAAGPCLFKDGFFLINNLPYSELISTSWSINERIPNYLIEQIAAQKNLEDTKVAILGLAFKKNSDDNRDSLSYKIIKILNSLGAKPMAHDPFIPSSNFETVLDQAEVIIIATNHDHYKNLGLKEITKLTHQKNVIVCDIWNLFETGKIISKLSKGT
jgi:UDP-N-acetyl-D-mannosaminuronic acid dehydrogenase